MDKALIAVMGGVFVLGMLMFMTSAVQAMGPQYICPICGVRFATYEELYSHFTTEHPAEDITIYWE